MKFRIQLTMLSAVIFYMMLSSCKKTTDNFDSDSSNSYSTVDNLFKDVGKVINDAAAENNISGKNGYESSTNALCATVTLNPADFVTFPKTVTVDFGPVGCYDSYGVYRKGKFTSVFTNYLNVPGAHVNVTFQDYYVNGVKLEGVYNLANTSPNNTGRTFADTITNGKATTSDGKICTWDCTRSSVQSAGFSTPQLDDDEYTGQANSTGVGFNGKSFTAVSTNILWKLACRYLVSGTVTIHSGTDPIPVVVDFGNGTCDNKYTATYGIYHLDLLFYY